MQLHLKSTSNKSRSKKEEEKKKMTNQILKADKKMTNQILKADKQTNQNFIMKAMKSKMQTQRQNQGNS